MQGKKLDQTIPIGRSLTVLCVETSDRVSRYNEGKAGSTKRQKKSNPIEGKHGLIAVEHAIWQPYFEHDPSSHSKRSHETRVEYRFRY